MRKKKDEDDKGMKEVKHQKAAGNGYLPGSPLYKAEQKVKMEKTSKMEPINLKGPPIVDDALKGEEATVPKDPDEAWEAYKKNWAAMTGAHLVSTLVSTVISVLIILCCAFVYLKNKVDPTMAPIDGLEHEIYLLDKKDFRFGLFDCFHTPPICLLSCCCPTIRWADTMRMAGLMAFYTAVVVMTVLEGLSPLSGGLTALIMLIMAVHQRQNIRRIFGMPAGDASTYLQDCCTYLCCPCCAVVQEARQIEEAYAVKHPVLVRVMPGARFEYR